MDGALRIGELAACTGEAVRTLRFWTDRGLLGAARGENGYRQYGPDAAARVLLIRRAQALGLTLSGVARLLDALARPDACAQLRRDLGAHLDSVRARRQALEALEDELSAALEAADRAPCGPGCHWFPAGP